jgi:hypothetical protein
MFGRRVLDLWGFDDIDHDGFRDTRLYTYLNIVYLLQ